MIRHVWSVLCAKSVTDNVTNNISLIDVVEQIAAVPPTNPPPQGTGMIPLPLEIVSLWARENPLVAARGRARVDLVAPDGSRQASFEFEIDLSKFERLRTQGKMNGVPVVGAGRYSFIVSLQQEHQDPWIEVARVPLQMVLGANPAESPAPPKPS
jgi:hypothetical protein